MANKYLRPEWRTTPIRAQIDEALREVEQIKQVLQSLRNKATQLDEYYRLRKGYMQLAMNRPGSDAQLQATYDQAHKPEQKMGEWSREAAAGDLAKLDGWMKSLIESELGLNTMLSSGIGADAINFGVKRAIWFDAEIKAWPNRSAYLLYSLNK